MSSEEVSIFAVVVQFSDHAVRIHYQNEYHWLPLSQIEHFPPNRDGMTQILLPAWLADSKGFV